MITATMVRIDWTEAPIVRVTFKKTTKIDCQQVEDQRGEYIPQRDAKMEIAAGKVVHFVRCAARPGWYYVVTLSGNQMRCTCTAHWNPRSFSCKHLEAVSAYCDQREQAEFAFAGESAYVRLDEVERDGYIYVMYRVVSSTYIGPLHYTWNENHTINRYSAAAAGYTVRKSA